MLTAPHNIGQCAEDFLMPSDPQPRDVTQTPMRSSGRMGHMALAFELIALSMRCRISHPVIAEVLENLNAAAIGQQQADDHQLSLLRGGPVGADVALVPVEEHEPHPLDCDTLDRLREEEAESVAAEIGSDPLVQLVVTTQERVERESAAFAQRQDGFVARVLGVLGVRRAA